MTNSCERRSMARGQLRVLLQHIRTVIGTPNADRVSDEQLLERFTAGQDSVAFDALLQRYGPMVLGVCRRVLAHEQDAEDAFQATFLVFIRKAASIRKRQSVGSWLYGVAYRIGVKARALASRRAVHEKQAPKRRAADPLSEVVWRD